MGRKKGGGGLMMWEMGMVLGYEKLLGMIEISFIVKFHFI